MNHALSHPNRRFRHYWVLPFITGLLFMLAGAGMMLLPFHTYYTLSVFISLTFAISGVAEISMGIIGKQYLENRVWRIVGGIADLVIGIIIFPEISIEGLSFLLAIFLMFRSVTMIGLSFSMRLYDGAGWLSLFLVSVLSLVLSLLLLWNPGIAGFTIGIFTGLAFFGVGLFIFLFSFRLRHIEILY